MIQLPLTVNLILWFPSLSSLRSHTIRPYVTYLLLSTLDLRMKKSVFVPVTSDPWRPWDKYVTSLSNKLSQRFESCSSTLLANKDSQEHTFHVLISIMLFEYGFNICWWLLFENMEECEVSMMSCYLGVRIVNDVVVYGG